MMKVVLLVLAALVAVQAKSVKMPGQFSYNNCGGKWPLMLNYLSIAPDPIVVPGSATVSLNINGTVGVTSPTPGDFVVTHLNSTTQEWDAVPCYAEGGPFPIGSCHYDDACSILSTVFPPDQPCPDAFIAAGVPCNCPYVAGAIVLNNLQITITNSFSFLEDGPYSVELSLYSQAGDEIGCITIVATLSHGA